MKANDAKAGEMYLSRTGIPVTVMGPKNGKVLIKLKTTGTFTMVNGDYELKPYEEKAIGKDSKALLKADSRVKSRKGGSLAAIIDPMLLAGTKTVAEMASELAKKAGEAGKGKDLAANVRARMVRYTRKGWKVVKDEKKRIKVVQPKA